MLLFAPASLEATLGVPEIFGYVLAFVLGCCIGSFLNVVIYRVPNEKSLLPGSACPRCGSSIKFYHNVPVVGWLMLGGKCSSCREPISWRYPAVELLTGVLFVLTYWQLGFTAMLPVGLVFVSAMIALIFIDTDHMILPNVITYPLFVAAIIVRAAFPLLIDGFTFPDMAYAPATMFAGQPTWVVSLVGAVAGALVGGGSLWLVGALWKALRGVDAMGLGDVKMMLGVGALLGWRLALFTIFGGAFVGALVGIVLVLKSRERNLQTQMPFGIFLGAAAIVALLVGERLVSWYAGMYS
jgi:leader peptidase (prepilin peptidase)/N-methyltransferase